MMGQGHRGGIGGGIYDFRGGRGGRGRGGRGGGQHSGNHYPGNNKKVPPGNFPY